MNKILVLILFLISSNSFASRFKRFGLQVDLGVPQVIAIDFIAKPYRYMDFKLGGTTDLVSGGIITGVDIFGPWVVSPILSLQGGYQFKGNFNRIINWFSSNSNQVLLNNVGFGHLELLGGLNFGRPNSHFQFFLKGGLGSIWNQTNGLQTFINQNSKNGNITVKEININVLFPTMSLGFNVWF